jgi:formylglycine-generating enzyme required for sulfatase activity
MSPKITRANVLLAAALLLCLLVAAIALAGGAASAGSQRVTAAPADRNATASASLAKQVKQVKQKVAALQTQVDSLARQPGPQGPQGQQGIQGPAGTAPACQGNGSGDTMVAAGTVCIDKYEVSVWSSPTGGTQYGATADNYPCNDNGQNCTNIFARSVAGVTPSRFITWFQAQQALANVGKRLPTNAEWQQAVAGTPAEMCNRSDFVVQATGIFSDCFSRFGAFDMVGNLWEWVGDWDEQAGGCAPWPPAIGENTSCVGMADTQISTRIPSALLRGGDFGDQFTPANHAGPFAIDARVQPYNPSNDIGFRGAR